MEMEMEIEIPPELLSPTVEELEKRTAHDMETEWKPSKRPGKKERAAKKTNANSLSSLFVKNEKPKEFPIKPKPPTLRVSLGSPSSKPVVPDVPNRKRGRPPKVKSV